VELRRTPRAPIDADVEYTIGKAPERLKGRARDISVGGMFVFVEQPAPFGAEVTITVTLPGQRVPFVLPGVVRWVGNGGMGVQFGLIGARETHAITEVVRESEASEDVKF